ncbi:biotin synthase [Capsaspora owczarzaki ATCC 30864]|uniref:biotin synthase n=2 Tax=Capsaspora owczarzaki (strain ATCC 30864) TaxID=595528 RepID=A0A0D2WIT7_CAPO3|nr:biotin synthase [Capsaspora owczarzaki ATCC 30864]
MTMSGGVRHQSASASAKTECCGGGCHAPKQPNADIAAAAAASGHASSINAQPPTAPKKKTTNEAFNELTETARRDIRIRHDWTRAEIQEIFDTPLLDLMYRAATVHRTHHDPRQVQQCTLLSIKTGGCSEDCAYCPQSSKYTTNVKAERLMQLQSVVDAARKAKEAGSTRFCMGAAWRDVIHRKSNFAHVLEMVSEVRSMGLEVCATLGMLSPEQAVQLKNAGLTAYNHNLDTSREFYPKIITTRTYDERLNTIANARDAGLSVCSGGIIGLGEDLNDRVGLLHTLSTLPTHPESVPVNALVPVPGTPLGDREKVKIWEMVRMIATARILMPGSMVRLSAGRVNFTPIEQALCFFAGANSIFTGDKLLTTANNAFNDDQTLFNLLGLVGKEPNFDQGPVRATESAEVESDASSAEPVRA